MLALLKIKTFAPFQILLDYQRAQKRINYRDHLKKKAVKSNSLIDWNHYRYYYIIVIVYSFHRLIVQKLR